MLGVPAIRSMLRGEAQLWKAFWLFYFVGSMLLVYVLQSLLHRLILIAPDSFLNSFTSVVFIAIVGIVYGLIAAFAVWRCSKNTSHRVWQFLARAAVIFHVFHLVWFLLSLATGGPSFELFLLSLFSGGHS